MPYVEKLADLLVMLLPIFLLTRSPGTLQEGGHPAQYWSWKSSDARALQVQQVMGMIAVGIESNRWEVM
jgi:hypothetical protein